MDAKLMTMRCDYCRGKFGLIVHRYWHMRFCSAACTQAYQQRLHDETKAKISGLAGAAVAKPPLLGLRLIAGAARHFTG
jgi:hypothetical protein